MKSSLLFCFSMIFAVFDVAWMVLYDLATQHLAVNMGVNFCCSYAFMAHHALDGAQVSAALEQVGGKRVAEGMRTDVFGDAYLLGQLFDEVKHHNARDAVTPTGQEEGVFRTGLDALEFAVLQPVSNLLDGAC